MMFVAQPTAHGSSKSAALIPMPCWPRTMGRVDWYKRCPTIVTTQAGPSSTRGWRSCGTGSDRSVRRPTAMEIPASSDGSEELFTTSFAAIGSARQRRPIPKRGQCFRENLEPATSRCHCARVSTVSTDRSALIGDMSLIARCPRYRAHSGHGRPHNATNRAGGIARAQEKVEAGTRCPVRHKKCSLRLVSLQRWFRDGAAAGG